MSDWSKDIDLEVIKEYLRECAENDDYHYEQYQIDIIMHEYIRQNQEIERLNNIIKRLEEFIEEEIKLFTVELTEENKNKLGYTAPIRATYKEIYNVLQELKGDGSNENS